MTDSRELEQRLTEIREKRGYLLPHHGLMAIMQESLLDAYDRLYSELALQERALTRHEHEFVWLAILIAMDEALGTHHIARFRAAGGSDAELEPILALTALAKGADAYGFVARHWQGHLHDHDPEASYLEAFQRAAGDTPRALAHLATAATYVCTENWLLLEWQICAAYADGVAEPALAEALSLALFPGSVPNFVEGAEVWRQLILNERVSASPAFRAWASLSGQGGYDEAARERGELE